MPHISNLGYLCLEASDLEQWKSFAVDLLGLQVRCYQSGKLLTLRMDDYEQRIVVQQGEADDLVAAGWKFDTAGELEAYVGELAAKGIEAERGPDELTASRRVERVYTCTDPDGLRHEFFYGPAYAPSDLPFGSNVLKSRFVTGDLGVGHFVSASQDYTKTLAFYGDVLGLKVSDYIRASLDTPEGAVDFDATFFHTETGRHHSFATAALPFPKRIHHIMVEVADFNDVGLAYERCLAAGYPMMMGLGHHPNDGMFSFYVISPSGFAVEYGYGGHVIDDDNWEVRSFSQLSDWGHAPPAED